MNRKPNRLADEKSPYLLQHAYNPVDWYPWSKEAFEAAIKYDKPVFLSIGYSTCHWCHVMEKESFEDPEVAEMMNEAFINIKVDREERPDIDSIYMNVCNILTGSGGWPLTIILTPDKKPFFAGTYFPKNSRFGRMGMVELVPAIKSAWQNQRSEVINSAEEILSVLRSEIKAVDEEIDKTIFEKAFDDFLKKYDRTYGGFGTSPKFPTPHNLQFILRYYKRNNDQFALSIVENTLINMRIGGIYDHLGSGFHRYSTDQKWRIPHFEKMLYDQALIALVFVETYQAAGKEIYKNTAEEIFEYILRDMTSPEGGFYSAEDADSEGEEGKFYLWTKQELISVLNDKEYELLSSIYKIEDNGNWIDHVSGGQNGTNILFVEQRSEAEVKFRTKSKEFFNEEYDLLRKKLFNIREKRIHPFKDDKILTDWNALMISALAKGGAVFGNNKYKTAAENAVQFILNKMFVEGKLLHRYREGDAAISGSLDDYAFLIQAMLDLYESVFNPFYLIKAAELTETVIKNFRDNEGGGFFFSMNEEGDLIVKQKEIYDGAVPSGNSVMILNLARLSRFTGNSFYEEQAYSAVKAFAQSFKKIPSAFTNSLNALDFILYKTFEIVIAEGKKGQTENIVNQINSEFIPGKVMLLRSDTYSDKLFRIAPFSENQKPLDEKTTVYVCSDFVCSNPVHTIEEVLEILHKQGS